MDTMAIRELIKEFGYLGTFATMALLWFRMGVIDEKVEKLTNHLDSFKSEAFKVFVTENSCELKRKACTHEPKSN